MSAPDIQPHESPIKTPKQLVVTVLLAFIVPIVIIISLAVLVTSQYHPDPDSPAMAPERVAERIRPVAEVAVGEGAPASAQVAAAPAHAVAPAAAGKVDGKKVYDTTCMACHAAGVANAPRFGDKKAWAPHLAHGVDALYQTAIKGKGAMPPKGGNLTLSDAEVKAAVDYMVSAVK